MMGYRARLLAWFVVVNALLALAAVYVLSNRDTPPLIQGVLLPEARDLPPFTLLDARGDSFSNADLRGRWHLVAYGFTTCPDFCPATLAQLAEVVAALAQRQRDDDLRILFYSVDHRRDTPERLAAYLPFFNADFVGLTHADNPDNPHLPFEQGLGITAQLVPNTEPGARGDPNDYQVLHGMNVYLLNPEGRLQAVFEPDRTGPTQFSFDPQRLLADYLAVRDYLG